MLLRGLTLKTEIKMTYINNIKNKKSMGKFKKGGRKNMAYNKQTALENQKAFLRSQAHCGYPNIEKTARETLKRIEEHEKAQKMMDERIKKFNEQYDKKRK